MSWLDRLERRFGKLAIHHLTVLLVGAQAFGFVLSLARPEVLGRMALVPARVLEGEVWRLITFLALPPAIHPVFLFFALYLLWLMGSALEAHWGPSATPCTW